MNDKVKYLIDISHPAVFHVFRPIIHHLESLGHEIVITARNQETIIGLLKAYEFNFIDRGTGGNTLLGKLVYMIKADWTLLKISRRFKPDVFISFSSPYAAQVAWLMKRPHIALNDTEHSDKHHKVFTYPFSKLIITPKSYRSALGKKHKVINSIFELMYLHPTIFTPNDSVLSSLNLKPDQPYVLLRFVAWNALHDKNQKGLSLQMKRNLIDILKQKYKVFISSEGPLEPEFQSYVPEVPVHQIHDLLAHADLYIGESATMASESAVLGTYAVYINSLPLMSYLEIEKEHGLLTHFSSEEELLPFVELLLLDGNLKLKAKKISKDFIENLANPFQSIMQIVKL